MKQSKKLLSIFLAMLMLLGTVSVVGNAALAKDQIAYDSIDNAKLTPEQVAGIILDMLDNDMLAGMETIDLSIVGSLRLDSVDHILADICKLRGGFVWAIGSGLLGDAGKLKFDALAKGDWDKPYQRSDGNLTIFYQLLQFIADNAGTLSKAAYGIGTGDGLSLGLIGNFLSLGDIEDILGDLPTFLTEMVYDMLIYGSNKDGKQASYEDIETLGSLPTEVNTLDKMVNVAIKNLLTKPQKYSWVPVKNDAGEIQYETDENGAFVLDEEGNKVPKTKKVWDEESYILNAAALEGKNLDLSKNSFFSLLDTVLPVAYETFGTVVLNHDVKKIFMEAMGVDFVRITDEKEIADITKAGTGYINVNGEGSENTPAADIAKVKNYFCNAQMWQVNGTWYFRDYVTTEIGTDAATGEPITEKRDRFFKAQTYSVDELYSIFNWDYELTASDLDFATMTSANGYGSLVGSLNHILYVILKKAINPTAIGLTKIDEIWVDGGNDNFNENLMKTAGFLLKNFTFMFFGRNEAYVDPDTLEGTDAFKKTIDDYVKANDREGLIAYMLLPLLGDVLPQLVYSADMFEPGLQIEQVAALLVREFLTDLTPQVNDYVCNYDAQIFADPTLKTGRSLVKGKDSAYWMNLVLNMGLDLAAIYLDNIANFGVDLNALKDLHSIANGTTIQPWQVVLEEIVDWAVLYVGSGKNSVINGLDPTTLGVERCVTYNYKDDSYSIDKTKFVGGSGKGSAFFTLSTALNTLLPLGIVNGGSSPEGSANNFGLDVEVVFNKLKNDIIPTLDIEGIIGLFGRNNHETNFLGQTNLYKEILDLVNQLLGCLIVNDKGGKILQVGTTPSTILADVISKASLKATVNNLLTGLNYRKQGLLEGALPLLALFISDWGGEQEIASPNLAITETTKADGGSLNVTLALRNGSKGVWRGYMEGTTRKQDEQYNYNVISISSLQGLGISGGTGALKYGTTANVTLSKSGVPATGLADRIDITYTVTDEGGNLMANGTQFKKSYFTYVSYDNEMTLNRQRDQSDGFLGAGAYEYNMSSPTYLYYAEEDLPNLVNDQFVEFYTDQDNKTAKIESAAGSANGIKISNMPLPQVSDGTVTCAPLSFDSAAYTSVGHAGASYKFTYKLNNTKNSTSATTTLFVYSGADYALLEDLVNDEVSKARVPEDYNIKNDEYNKYLGALANGMAVIYNPRVDGNFWTDCYARYEALKNAVEALEAVEKTEAEKAEAGGSIDGLVDNLKTQLDGIQKNFDGKDYRTYMLYRWEKYKSARSDANWIIDLKEEVKFGAPTKHFPYGSYSQAQYTNLVAGDKYETFLKALLVDMTEEEKAQAAENYKNRSNEYYGQTTLDVAQYSNLLTRMSQRLILRTSTPVTSYLQKEIDSAKKDIGTSQGNYSKLSWDPYAKALSDAEAALSSKSQDVIFAAKYQLQVTRNNLRTVEKEADYSELKELIAQAENALVNSASYKNATASPEDFGKLLIALGYSVGDTKLFGGAKDVVNYSYDKHDQDEVDDAADELKAALAKLEFNDFATTKPQAVGTTQVATGEKDENGDDIKESIYTAKIDAKKVKKDVATLLAVSGCTVEVSLDEKYSAASDATLNENKLPVGTGATVTIIKDMGSGVKVPVATIKVIVEGDVTGDGVIDAMDCMVVDLVANNNSSLGGVYFAAGDSDGNGAIKIEDLNPVITKALA